MEASIATQINKLFNVDTNVKLTRPDPQFGDWATNVALQLAGQLGKSPREIAELLAVELRATGEYSEVSVAGPGFINLRLSDETLLAAALKQPVRSLEGKNIVTEYSDPNPFKVLHAGHLYTTIIGDVISRLLEAAGATVHRVNFGGDVGLHVAKNMWAIMRSLDGDPSRLSEVGDDPHQRASWLSARYVEGNTAYETDEMAKREIIDVNKKIYDLHALGDHESVFAQIYWTCRQWSYEYFEILYRELEVVPFEKYYPESMTTPTGVKTVERETVKGVYTESNGAIVFVGEPYGLHTRVFINSEGLPTYETKDVGLIMQKWLDYKFDQSIMITGNDIIEYMKVVQKSIEQYEPELVKRSLHITHGNLRLAGGRKMSSRKGTVLLALDVLESAVAAQQELVGNDNRATVLGAVKYAFLSQRIGGDIVYDPAESVSIHGNSGPYLQYAHARACGILTKSQMTARESLTGYVLNADERALVVKLGEYHEVVERATNEFLPHLICTYLYELSQQFNRFYEQTQVVGSEHEAERLRLVTMYRDTLANGLGLLGIDAPQQM